MYLLVFVDCFSALYIIKIHVTTFCITVSSSFEIQIIKITAWLSIGRF